jgi:LCP family protein required for cell wall assembly
MKKWKIMGSSLLGLIVIGAATAGYEYNQLQPKNHFKSIPVVSVSASNTTQTNDRGKNPVFNILLMGSDERNGQNVGHSDSMILIHMNLNKNEFHAISIPRDTRVYLDGYGYTKLTSVQYVMQSTKGPKAGVEAAVKAISDLTGVPINYYVETNYEGLQSMVDTIGGINMNIPFNVTLTHPWYPEDKNKVINAGNQFLDGKMVTEIVHERYSLPGTDYGRQQLQEEALKGIAKEALSPQNITKLPSLIKSMSNYVVETNMSTSDILSLGLAMKNFDPNQQLTFEQIHGVGENIYDDVLNAKNDEIVIDPQQLKNFVAKDFKS